MLVEPARHCRALASLVDGTMQVLVEGWSGGAMLALGL
jgi:hypothetical protein